MSQRLNIAILGPGLLGGSVALAARKFDAAADIHLWARRQKAVDEIASLGIADLASTDLAEVVYGAQLIILATPVGVMPRLVEQLVALPGLGDVVITDLGSVKGSVVSSIDKLLAENSVTQFVGSHPMAGKEQAGIEHATADLFSGAACVITPGSSSSPKAIECVNSFWQQLGCNTRQMTPENHDAAVARISHLPHLAASLIAATALEQDSTIGDVAGAGLRDTTRVASGPPDMWTEILLENRDALAPALEALAAKLAQAQESLASGDSASLQALLAEAKNLRDALDTSDAD